jgi:hypothetical protein
VLSTEIAVQAHVYSFDLQRITYPNLEHTDVMRKQNVRVYRSVYDPHSKQLLFS